MITVFFDGKCGLCSREINHYRQLASDKQFKWQDVYEPTTDLHSLGITLSQSLKRLHALDNTGQLHIGADAFILIWSQLPRWRLLAKVVALPGIHQLVRFGYGLFADWKFKHSKHCQLSMKDS